MGSQAQQGVLLPLPAHAFFLIFSFTRIKKLKIFGLLTLSFYQNTSSNIIIIDVFGLIINLVLYFLGSHFFVCFFLHTPFLSCLLLD